MKGFSSEKLSEEMGIPKEVSMDLSKLSFAENRELYIENHRGILEYSESVIRVRSKFSIIKIEGTDFKISYISEFDILIRGVFFNITFEH